VVLEFDTPPTEQGNPSLGKARFLVEDAPADWLFHGQAFEMHEGRRMTARVAITAWGRSIPRFHRVSGK